MPSLEDLGILVLTWALPGQKTQIVPDSSHILQLLTPLCYCCAQLNSKSVKILQTTVCWMLDSNRVCKLQFVLNQEQKFLLVYEGAGETESHAKSEIGSYGHVLF